MDQTKLDESSIVVAGNHQTSAEVDGERVILDLEEGIYYGLDSVGARIWTVIQEPTSVSEVVNTLTAEYDVKQEQCLADVVALLHDLKDRGLIVVKKA